MAIHAKRDVDLSLPTTVLYLDDVEAIADILTKKAPSCPSCGQSDPISFETARHACDSVSDLERLGIRAVHELTVRSEHVSVRIERRGSFISLNPIPEDSQSIIELTGLIRSVFTPRSRFLNRTRLIIGWVLLGFVLLAPLLMVADALKQGKHYTAAGTFQGLAWGMPVVLFQLAVVFAYPRTVIRLWRSHEATPESMRWTMGWRGAIKQGLTVLISVGVTGAAAWVVRSIFK